MPRDLPQPGRRRFLQQIGLGALATLGAGSPRVTAAPNTAGADDCAAAAARVQPPELSPLRVALAASGVPADGRTDARPALQALIDRCATTGGGCIVLGPGVWWSEGPIHLKHRVQLHLEAGAILRFSPKPESYLPVVLTRWEGTELFNYSPCLYAYQAGHLAITGAGTIDGNAGEICTGWRKLQKPDKALARDLGARGVPLPGRVFGAGHFLRWPLIQFLNCDHVLVEGVTVLGSPFWSIHAVSSQHVTVRGVRVDGPHLNNDCFDPESCSDVLIEDCVFRSGDDCIAIKSGRDQDGWRIGRPSENIVIRRCDLASTTAAALAIGSEMSGGVRRVFIEDCRIGHARYAINFKGNLDRGGIVEHVRVRGVTVDNAAERFIQFSSEYQGFRGNRHAPLFRDFVLESISCRDSRGHALHFSGAPDAPVTGVTLRHITVAQAELPLFAEHIRGIAFDDVRINGALVPSPTDRT